MAATTTAKLTALPISCPSPLPRQSLVVCSYRPRIRTRNAAFPLVRARSISSTSARASHSSTSSRRASAFLVSSPLSGLSDTAALSQENEFLAAAAVYAIYDGDGEQLIGISRNVTATVADHRRSLPDLCRSLKERKNRVLIVIWVTIAGDQPDKETLTQACKSWMEKYVKSTGKVPSGNESGNAMWIRQPPRKKSDLRHTPVRHLQLTVPLKELIDKSVKENKVVAFIKGSRSAPLCGFSQKVIDILESKGLDYESVTVLDEEHNPGLRDILKTYSNWPTFPQIFVDGELVCGCDILNAMHKKRELARLLKL